MTRATGQDAFYVPLVVGLVFAVIALAILIACLPSPRWHRSVVAGSAWNFNDSFATNVTAVGGLLAAALTAFGASSTLLPGIQLDRYSLLSALWASLAVIAPVVIGLVTKPDTSKPKTEPAASIPIEGLLLALGVILLAAGAELMTLIVLISKSSLAHGDQVAIDAALALVGILTGAYVIRTTRTLVSTQGGDNGPHSSLQSFTRTSLLP